MTEPEDGPEVFDARPPRNADDIRKIANLTYAARTAAVLLRDAASAVEQGRRIDPELLYGAARSLDEIAGGDA